MDVQLKVVQGRPQGQLLRFGRGEFIFGRGPECHVQPNSPWVSRQHCILRVRDEAVIVRDLGSTNGTLINGTLVREEIPLQHGDLLQVGPLLLEVILSQSHGGPTRETVGRASGATVADTTPPPVQA